MCNRSPSLSSAHSRQLLRSALSNEKHGIFSKSVVDPLTRSRSREITSIGKQSVDFYRLESDNDLTSMTVATDQFRFQVDLCFGDVYKA